MLYCIATWCIACNCIRGTFIVNGVCFTGNKYCISIYGLHICLAKHSNDWRQPLHVGWYITMGDTFYFCRNSVFHTNLEKRTFCIFLVLGGKEKVSPNDRSIQCLKWCSDSFQSKCKARWWGSRWVASSFFRDTPVAKVSFHQYGKH